MKKYLQLGWLMCLLSANVWAKEGYVVLHNHTGKKIVLSYQADQGQLQLLAGPGMSVSNVDPSEEYRMTGLMLDGVVIEECEGISFDHPYSAINLTVSGFKQITCWAQVHD